jgi:hypothetical protein
MRFGNHAWLQFVPLLAGAGWALFFWRGRRSCWSWSVHLPAVLLVSLVTSAYGWLFDQSVLLPAVMQVGVPLESRAGSLRRQAIAAYVGTSALMIIFVIMRKTGTSYTWTAPAWLALYIWLRRGIAIQDRPLSTASSELGHAATTAQR